MTLSRNPGVRRVHEVGAYRAGEAHVAVTARRTRGAKSNRPGVIYCHAASFGADSVLPHHPIVDAIAAAGYPVIAPDLGGPWTFGNAEARAAVTDAYRYVQHHLGARPGPALLVGASMGALNALTWALDHPGSALGVAAMLPIVNLRAFHGENRGGHAARVEAAHGGVEGLRVALDRYDPLVNAHRFEGSRLALWYSVDDTVCPATDVEAFAARTGAMVESIGQVGHTLAVDPIRVVAFLDELADGPLPKAADGASLRSGHGRP